MEYVVSKCNATDEIIPAGLPSQVLDLDNQCTSTRTAVGDVEALQSNSLAVKTGEHRAVVAQTGLVRNLGANRDALGKGAP